MSILAIAGAAALGAGCGGDEGEEASAGTDLTAVYCPMVPTDEEVSGTQQYEPADESFDTTELLGMQLGEARRKAAEHGCEIVISFKDGKGVPVSLEIDPKRIFVYTERGVVTHIEGVGGGL